MNGATHHVNGRLRESDAARVAADDRGFLLGDAAGVVLRAFGGSVFARESSLALLERAGDRLGIDVPDDVGDRVEELLAAADRDDAVLRVTVSRGRDRTAGLDGTTASGGSDGKGDRCGDASGDGDGGDGSPGRDRADSAGDRADDGPTVAVALRPASRGGVDGPAPAPATVQTVTVRRPADRAVPVELAHRGPSSVLARRELVADADEALVRGPGGGVVGGARSTVWFVDDRGLHTPGLDAGPVYPGVVRSRLLSIAEAADLPVYEDAPDPADLRDAREAFLSGVAAGVRPIETVDGVAVGRGPVTALLARRHRERVEREHY